MLNKITALFICLGFSGTPAFAQEQHSGKTTGETQLYAGPGKKFGAVTTLPPNMQFMIIPPKSVFIGKGVVIGKGVLIEGKPWHQVQLPDGRTGYLAGSLICLPSPDPSGNMLAQTMGLCQN